MRPKAIECKKGERVILSGKYRDAMQIILKGGQSRQDKWPLKGVYILIPGACEYMTLQGKRGFADVIT